MKSLVKLSQISALTVALGLSLMPASAFALPDFDRVVVYYSDASMTGVTGQFTMNCFGDISMEGYATQWSIEERTRCDPDGHPGGPRR
jgi:hypothetical protein